MFSETDFGKSHLYPVIHRWELTVRLLIIEGLPRCPLYYYARGFDQLPAIPGMCIFYRLSIVSKNAHYLPSLQRLTVDILFSRKYVSIS